MVTVVTDHSAAVGVRWASFDPRAVLGDVPSTSRTPICKTINGREVRMALRFAAPPAASYVHLDTDDCVYHEDPIVVAADGDLLLIHMLVKIAEGARSWRNPVNFFVCKVDLERPRIESLPYLGDRVFACNQTGIVRCGASEDFFVADLLPRRIDGVSGTGTGEVVMAQLFRYSSTTGQWDLKRLDMPAELGVGLDPLCWEADAVFAFRGLMCWADYHRGLLFCDVAAHHPELRFVRFPGIEIRDDFVNSRGAPEEYRTASVSHGRLWFVDIDDGCFPATCTVVTWTLRTPEMEWVKEHTLCLSHLWSHWRYRGSPLPRSVPLFPIVDMQQADVLHFVVRESFDATMNWTITVDMKNRCLMDYAPYENDRVTEPIQKLMWTVDDSNMFEDIPLVCCKYA